MPDNKEFILLMFEGYNNRKKEKRLYSKDDNIPKMIIKTYIDLVEKASFKNIISSYKKKYIYHESRVESNMSKEEQKGLAEVYNYINNFDFDKDQFNVFITSMIIHNKLFSYCGDGTFGGKLRTSTAVMYDLDIDIASPKEVLIEFNKYILKKDYILEKYKKGDIFGYIEDCVKLSVELIKLQPFADGNKRTFRALINLLFKRLNIPPIYVENKEREEYKRVLIKAMKAEKEEDYDDIIRFYMYKICDAIVTLDINNSELLDKDNIKKENQIQKK